MVKSYSNKNLFLFFIIVFSLLCLIFYFFYLNHQVEGMSIILNGESTDEYVYGESINKDGYLDGIDVVYYINLDRSIDRRNHMERIFENSVFDEIPVIRIPACDGKNEDMKKYFTIEKVGNIDNTIISNVEYACTLSHLFSIKKFSESTYDIALICEDDITLEYKKYWKKTINDMILAAPSDWEIIQVAINPINPVIFEQLKKNEYLLNINYTNNPEYNAFSTTAYIVNKMAAQKIIRNHYKNNIFYLDNQYLHVADSILYRICKTYICLPYFTYTTTTSTIHQSDIIQHSNSKNMVTNFLKDME